MGDRLKGVDVSHWQNEIDWLKVSQSEYNAFAYIKASERFVVDKFFISNWKNAKGLVPRGAYMYFHPEAQVQEQIDYFCDLIQGDVGEVLPALDVEDSGNLLPSILAEKVLFALQRIEDRLKVKPILYTGANFWNTNVKIKHEWCKNYLLWIAQYNLNITQPSKLPFGWEDWAIWQYYDRGVLDGITGKKPSGVIVNRVDYNYMKPEKASDIFIKGVITLEQRVERIEKVLKEKGIL